MKRTSDAGWVPRRPSRTGSNTGRWRVSTAIGPVLATARLVLRPVGWGDLAEVSTLKADPRAFAVMLGGVRTTAQSVAELADDLTCWGQHGVGMWVARLRLGDEAGKFAGIAGIMERPDGRGLSLRFALSPAVHGHGLAREAAGAALRYALDVAGLPRVIAVTRADNFASRTILGGIGMRAAGTFGRDGHAMMVYASGGLLA